MSFGTAVKTCFKKYVTFSGRATRAEYWWFQAFLVLAYVAIFLFGVLVSMSSGVVGAGENAYEAQGTHWSFWIMLGLINFSLITFLPALSVTIRRLHDAGHSGWCLLYNLIPYVGSLIIFIFTLQGSEENNLYGEKPIE